MITRAEEHIFPSGAVVAQRTVNPYVAGSNPAWGARTFPTHLRVGCFVFIHRRQRGKHCT